MGGRPRQVSIIIACSTRLPAWGPEVPATASIPIPTKQQPTPPSDTFKNAHQHTQHTGVARSRHTREGDSAPYATAGEGCAVTMATVPGLPKRDQLPFYSGRFLHGKHLGLSFPHAGQPRTRSGPGTEPAVSVIKVPRRLSTGALIPGTLPAQTPFPEWKRRRVPSVRVHFLTTTAGEQRAGFPCVFLEVAGSERRAHSPLALPDSWA